MNSKRKGNSGELEILHLLEQYGIDCQRNDQRYISGFQNPDIEARVRGHPVHVEVKRTEKLSLYDAMTQAVSDANGKALPIVCHRRNRKPWVVIIRLSDLLEIMGFSLK